MLFMHVLTYEVCATCETMPLVCSNASGHYAWTAGSTGRVHFTRAGASLKCKGQTIRAIKTAEKAFPNVISNKCLVHWDTVIYF